MPAPSGFTHRQHKDGAVDIFHHGRLAATLRKFEAEDFRAEMGDLDTAAAQALMARLTGNYKRGNEGLARSHPRNRAH